MNKLKMHSFDIIQKNIEKMKVLFPSCVTEAKGKDGEIKLSVDFDRLKQELSYFIVEGPQERYQLDWPGKREALLTANMPITKTLRPCSKESVNFDDTKNLFIEGDNLDVLKLLQETYLAKVKMIYIDPPYNTGTAMIYKNDFSEKIDKYLERTNQIDENGNSLVVNRNSNGRFHSDWLSMMYSRLKLARNLLTDDGFAILAMDDSEIENLIKICDEIFGSENRISIISVVHKPEGRNQEKFIGTSNEFALIYAKNKSLANFNNVVLNEEVAKTFKFSDSNSNYKLQSFISKNHGRAGKDTSLRINKPQFWYPIFVSPDLQEITVQEKVGYKAIYPVTSTGQERTWNTSKDTCINLIKKGELVAINKDDKISIFQKYREKQVIKSHWIDKKYNAINYGTKILDNLMQTKTFDFPKSLYLLIDLLKLITKNDDLIMDFFAGSSTTAHAVMQLNAEDGGNRRFIMVQFPEKCDQKSEAFKAGYQNIAEISKERIRRAGTKVLKDNFNEQWHKDIGFRVLKLDSSNMADVYYSPEQLKQDDLFKQIENIKADRTDEDLLFQILLDWGIDLSLPVKKEIIQNKLVFFVDDNALAACFNLGVDENLIKELANKKPLRVVFRNDGFDSDVVKINAEQIFKQISPNTEVKVI